MQPITINIEIISHLLENWADAKSQREFHKLAENLEQFHQVYIDKIRGKSIWLNKFRQLGDNIKDPNIKDLFNNLIGPRNIKYYPVKIDKAVDYLIEVTRQTPDKIGLDKIRNVLEDINFYDLSEFNSNNFNTRNVLFRIPKSITIPPDEEFSDLRLFAPYVRDAVKIEFCDLFLFKNPEYDNDSKFLLEILGLCRDIDEVEIHCEPNPLNVLQKEVEKWIKSNIKKNVFKGFKKYNPPTRDVNHDRFIIIDHDKISIRFTTSFNNMRISESGNFFAKDSFLIEFSRGRKYYS